MKSHTPTAAFALVEGSSHGSGSLSADARWRGAVAEAMHRTMPGANEVGLDFELEPDTSATDLVDLVLLALAGLQDAGVLAPELVGVERIVATKRPGTAPRLGVSLAWDVSLEDDDPFGSAADLTATSDTVPREESPSEKMAWRDAVDAAWRRPPVTRAVGVDIAVTKTTSLASMLKPVIDGLEPYLRREPLGRGTLRPGDEQVVWLRISRTPALAVGLRIRAGEAPPPGTGRMVPPVPPLPEMDSDFTWSTSDLEAIDRYRAWHRIFAPGSGLFG